MNLRELALVSSLDDHRGRRQHRFMESADIGAAFREIFGPLRTNIRRGMSVAGQVYAVEMDTCLPGEVLGATWIPLATRGIEHADELVDASRRRAFFGQLLTEQRPEALWAYVDERGVEAATPWLHVEIVSADAVHVAEYGIVPGNGWHLRDLVWAPHARRDPISYC